MRRSNPASFGSMRVKINGLPHLEQGGRRVSANLKLRGSTTIGLLSAFALKIASQHYVTCWCPWSNSEPADFLHFPFALGRSTRSSRNSGGPLVRRRRRCARSSVEAVGSIIFSITFLASSCAREPRPGLLIGLEGVSL